MNWLFIRQTLNEQWKLVQTCKLLESDISSHLETDFFIKGMRWFNLPTSFCFVYYNYYLFWHFLIILSPFVNSRLEAPSHKAKLNTAEGKKWLWWRGTLYSPERTRCLLSATKHSVSFSPVLQWIIFGQYLATKNTKLW